VTKDEGNNDVEIIVVNVIPPDHVDDVPVVERNQHVDVPVVPEHVLVDEDEDPKEDEFKEEKDPQEEEDDLEVDIEEDGNEPELTYPYEEVDPLNPPPPASESRPKDAIDDMEVDIEEDGNEPELTYPYEEVDPLNPPPPASESEPEDAIEVEHLIKHEDETVPASVHKVGESSTAPFLCEDGDGLFPGLMRRDINFLFGRMDSVSRRLCGRETAHALVEKKRKAKEKYYDKLILDLGNEIATMGLEIVNQMPWTEMKQLMTAEFCPIKKVQRMEPELWNLKVKEYNIVAYTQRFNELALMCPKMVEPKRVKVNAYISGLTDNVKGEVTSSMPVNLNEAVHMAHKLMEHKSQARDEIILEGKKRKWKNFQ
nr:hypothetical protein [Tanacetum cinerariifolium]